ncbi:hypothetical protein [Myceligenerans crystallogenes]|uniref:hypothetical protein n=1 Tax=Myceligenerans crystallogenes TaxID=316335 RepID=UPI0031DA9D53
MHLIDSTELVRVAVPDQGLSRDLLIRRLDTLAGIEHPNLVRVVTISPSGRDRMDVRLDRPDAADLPTVLASRGPFTAAEASGMVTGVARALAALHAAGLAHGTVEATDVLFAPDGTALLRPRLEPPVPAASEGPAEDIPSLARVAQSVLRSWLAGSGGSPAPLSSEDLALRAELAKARTADLRDRLAAKGFAARVQDVVAPQPVRMPTPEKLRAAARTGPIPIIGPAAGGRVLRRVDLEPVILAGAGLRRGLPPVLRGHRRPPAVLVAVSVAGLVCGLGAGIVATVSDLLPGDAAAAASASRGPSPEGDARSAADLGADMAAITDRGNPARAAKELTRLRMMLLSGMPVEVSDVDLAGSPAYAADAALLERITRWGAHVSGATVNVAAAEVVGVEGTGGTGGTAATRGAAAGGVLNEAVVRVEYSISAYLQVGDSGATQVPKSGIRSAMLSMTWTTDGWRVARVFS